MTAEVLRRVNDPVSHFPLWYAAGEGEDSATAAPEKRVTAWTSKSGKKKKGEEEKKPERGDEDLFVWTMPLQLCCAFH